MLPVASECFSNDGVVWFLQTLGLFVKARKVPLRYGFDPVKWTVALDGPKKKETILRDIPFLEVI